MKISNKIKSCASFVLVFGIITLKERVIKYAIAQYTKHSVSRSSVSRRSVVGFVMDCGLVHGLIVRFVMHSGLILLGRLWLLRRLLLGLLFLAVQSKNPSDQQDCFAVESEPRRSSSALTEARA